MTDFPRSTGTVELDRPPVDQAARFEAVANAAIAARGAENGQAELDRKNRERLEADARHELLAGAPAKERDALRKQQEQLRRAEATVHAAEAAAGQAREADILARIGGQKVSERAVQEADARYVQATKDRGIAQKMVAAMEARIIANVRAEQRRVADATQQEIWKQWTAATATARAGIAAIETLEKLHAADIEVSRDIEASTGALPVRWSSTHEQVVPIKGFGEQHVTTPNLEISSALREQMAELAERLG